MDPTIYVSSKKTHSEMWLTHKSRGYNIISSWIHYNEIFETEQVGQTLWPQWIAEAASADYLIFWAKPGENSHESCLLEIGACLAAGGTILHVGVTDTMKSGNGDLADFVYHPKWFRIPELETALRIASLQTPLEPYR
jgi:hypothetical protein